MTLWCSLGERRCALRMYGVGEREWSRICGACKLDFFICCPLFICAHPSAAQHLRRSVESSRFASLRFSSRPSPNGLRQSKSTITSTIAEDKHYTSCRSSISPNPKPPPSVPLKVLCPSALSSLISLHLTFEQPPRDANTTNSIYLSSNLHSRGTAIWETRHQLRSSSTSLCRSAEEEGVESYK